MRKPSLEIEHDHHVPVVRDVHDAGMLLAEGVDLAKRLADIQEAVGAELYRFAKTPDWWEGEDGLAADLD